MTITCQNQRPQNLSPGQTFPYTGDFDLSVNMQKILAPIYTPLNQGPVTLSADGQDLPLEDLAQMALDALSDRKQADLEDTLSQVFAKTLVNYRASRLVTIDEVFVTQAALKAKLPLPGPTTLYTPATDIIPTCKAFLAGQANPDDLLAAFGFTNRLNLFGVYFATASDFTDFKTWFNLKTQTLTLPPETKALLRQFQSLNLNKNLTESLVLRNDLDHNNHENSFARLLVYYLTDYYASQVQPANHYGLLPFSLIELACPKNLVFINLEKHAHADTRTVMQEWDMIRQALLFNIKIRSNKNLQSLTAVPRQLQALKGVSAAYKTKEPSPKAANIPLSKKPPSVANLSKVIKKRIEKMASAQMTQNTYKKSIQTFQVPNRRDPLNFNLMGKSKSTRYYPDIHLYIDTSGSISVENYEYMVTACLKLAAKLNTDLIFNSFSHELSQPATLRVKSRSIKDAYRDFMRVPKVTGGTDYEQIWQYINASPKRQSEFSLIITDFEWRPPNHHVIHPKNLYYAPCAKMDWSHILNDTQYFLRAMESIDPYIRYKILF